MLLPRNHIVRKRLDTFMWSTEEPEWDNCHFYTIAFYILTFYKDTCIL